MGDYRLKIGFLDHPKTVKLKRRTGAEGVLALIRLIEYCATNTSRCLGSLHDMDDEAIEIAARWTGEPDALVRALIDVGFLDGPGGMRTIHEFAEHQPWLAGARERSERARRAANMRHHGTVTPETDSMPPACAPDATSMPAAKAVPDTGLLPLDPGMKEVLGHIRKVWTRANKLEPRYNPAPDWEELVSWLTTKMDKLPKQIDWSKETEEFGYYWTEEMINNEFTKARRKQKAPQFRIKQRLSTWMRYAGGEHGRRGAKGTRRNGRQGGRASGALDPGRYPEYDE